ncbi:hypothetical protein METBIDRAFT_217227 [Metschnikowia bicuspidata var. bicuspidata NRRL YB-4993]|uniref:Uncharacterized protein n=1 Tax=Metschnikowia bicuspidata var. bicuspidata NRRL YB-4993 TaxID=869754 RepID=A0A1A0H6Q0_9ASCO|nr:hypothetical protein METBIDRAFT_217227 [Metschnikowia bicuspidata var. bicuspidata NRRL YB-4993]OBA19588.1 hypothetical protein METBIDRAFT_217227 [Metschnikowia bicuspidata var. bicuspidata NRRL YB-4993]
MNNTMENRAGGKNQDDKVDIKRMREALAKLKFTLSLHYQKLAKPKVQFVCFLGKLAYSLTNPHIVMGAMFLFSSVIIPSKFSVLDLLDSQNKPLPKDAGTWISILVALDFFSEIYGLFKSGTRRFFPSHILWVLLIQGLIKHVVIGFVLGNQNGWLRLLVFSSYLYRTKQNIRF